MLVPRAVACRLLAFAASLAALPAPAGAVAFRLDLVGGPTLVEAGQQSGSLAVTSGQVFRVVLGLQIGEQDGALPEVFAYTLDLTTDGLDLLGATQLACVQEGVGCQSVEFLVDPVAGGRASVFGLERLSIAAGVLELEFQAARADFELTIGLLDPRADAITGIDTRGVARALDPDPPVIQLVPEPDAGGLVALGLVGLAIARRRRHAAALVIAVAGLLVGGDAGAQRCDATSGLPLVCDEPAEQAALACQCRATLLLPLPPPGDATDIVAADDLCAQAAAEVPPEDPQHAQALLFRAATRILRVLGANEPGPDPSRITDSFVEMMDAFFISPQGRNLYDWTAKLPKTLPDGTPCQADGLDGTPCQVDLPDTAPGGGEVQETLAGLAGPLRPVLDASIEDLRAAAASPGDEVLTLCEPELATLSQALGIPLVDVLDPAIEEVEIDRGDLKLFEVALLELESQLLLIDALDTEIDLDAYTKLQDPSLVQQGIKDPVLLQQELFDPNPQLGALRGAKEAELQLANEAHREAIVAYFDASNSIREETDSQDEDLFTIETFAHNGTILDAKEQDLREQLAGLRGALDRPTRLLAHDPTQPPADLLIDEAKWIGSLNSLLDAHFDHTGVALDLGLFYEARPFSPREVMPEFKFDPDTQRNFVASGLLPEGSFPDRTFRGALVPVQDPADVAGFRDCFNHETNPFLFPPDPCLARDIDGDGFVGGRDSTLFLIGFGAQPPEPPPPLPVLPEPACGLGFELAFLLAPLHACRRRRKHT